MPKNQLVVFLLLIFLILTQGQAQAAPGDTTADAVLGQANFTGNLPNGGGAVSAAGLEWPYGLAVNPTNGRLFMSDYKNNRVLSWPNAESFSNAAPADIVLGQPNFTSNQANQGGSPDADTLYGPVGITIDKHTGRLFVAEYLNHRVVSYAPPITTGMSADVVYGQPDFTSNTPNNGGVSNESLQFPWGVALDSTGQLYISDYGNHRILVYYAGANRTDAFEVFGQTFFSDNTPNSGGISAQSLNSPAGINIPATADMLTVADTNNNRVLLYDLSDGNQTADIVLGQNGSFTTNTPNNGGLGSKSLWLPSDVAFDSGNSLYVADRNNNRVLRYGINITVSDTADQVFGQPNFTSNTANNGGISANSLNFPYGITVTPSEHLLVADRSNNRVLRYDQPQPSPTPSLVNVAPTEIAVGSPSFQLYVSGSHFTPDSTVLWNGQVKPTTYLNAAELLASISAADVASPFSANIRIVNPLPGGTSSAILTVDGYTPVAGDKTADRIIGQPNFNADEANNWQVGGLGPRSISSPNEIAIDPSSGRLYISETANNRILSWPSAASFTNADPADLVIGQKNLYTDLNVANNQQNASTLDIPQGITVDANNNLYVADVLNNRVLVFLDPIATDTVADFVFGQPDFTSRTENNGGISANSLYHPYDVVVKADGTLYIADHNNNRILIYFNPLTSDRTADLVIGQPNFTTGTAGFPTSATNLTGPRGIDLDSQGRLYVADYSNNRVLAYEPPLTNGAAADFLLGQPNFTSNTDNNGGLSAYSLRGARNVTVDLAGNVFVSDFLNHRVLIYQKPVVQNDRQADFVLGQPNFSSNQANQGGDPSADTLYYPIGLAVGSNGQLFVVDDVNHRILNYDFPLFSDFSIFLPVSLK